MTTYYLSGPMRGKPNHNREMFEAVEKALRLHLNPDAGEVVGEVLWDDSIVNPQKNFGGRVDLPVSDYMCLDLKQVLEADVIVQLPGWQMSEGAKREIQTALWAGKKFLKAEPIPETDSQWTFVPTNAPEFSNSPRADLLDEAKQLITGDRNNAYGDPLQDFLRSAEALNAYGYRGPDGRKLLPHDVAIFVMAVKLSRLMWTPQRRDSWTDLAGYAGCGYECSTREDL